MVIRALKLKESKLPGKTELYEVKSSRNIIVEEEQEDSSLDRVILEYCIEDKNMTGYFAKEYRPANVRKGGAKKIDITAAMINHFRKNVRWHLYDIKDTLAGEHTIVKLYNQWNAGLSYLQENILSHILEYTEEPHLGVIVRNYDEKRMERLRDEYQERCNERKLAQKRETLSLQKRRPDIPKEKAVLKAAKAMLDREFQAENGVDTYEIHIKQLNTEDSKIYKIKVHV